MSHSTGAVKFKDGTIKWFEYNGTVDVAQPKLYNSYKELKANWRTLDWPICEDASHKHEKVRIVSTYGYGFSWDGFACSDCNCLLSPLGVNYDTETSGLPEWFLELKDMQQYFGIKKKMTEEEILQLLQEDLQKLFAELPIPAKWLLVVGTPSMTMYFGNACVICAKDALIKFIEEHNLTHTEISLSETRH